MKADCLKNMAVLSATNKGLMPSKQDSVNGVRAVSTVRVTNKQKASAQRHTSEGENYFQVCSFRLGFQDLRVYQQNLGPLSLAAFVNVQLSWRLCQS